MRRLRQVPLPLALLALLAIGACSTSGATSGQRRQNDLITRDEIASAGVSNALEAVEQLRPHFLRPRGGVSIRGDGKPSPPQVFVDGLEVGGPEALLQVPASMVLSIQFSPNRDTEARLGSGQYGGVIRVHTGRPSTIPPAADAVR